jgi:hypothetical protein
MGMAYEMRKSGRNLSVAFLFDGQAYRHHVSKLLQGKWTGDAFEAVVRTPGDLTEIRELSAQLCISLEQRTRRSDT